MMVYVIWSHEHQAYWRPEAMGYTTDLAQAGRYRGSDAALPVISDVMLNEVAIAYPIALEKGPPKFHPYKGAVA